MSCKKSISSRNYYNFV